MSAQKTPAGVDYADCSAVELQAECYRLIREHKATLAAFRRVFGYGTPMVPGFTHEASEAHDAASAAIKHAKEILGITE